MSSGKTKSDLPLVPESVLRKRHDLDDLARKRAARVAAESGNKKKERKLNGKKAFYVKKPETFIARAKSRRNHDIRFKRVLKKGMQKRASDKVEMAVQEIAPNHDDNSNDVDGQVVKVEYQSNSVGANMVFAIRIRDHIGEPRSVRRTLASLRLRNIHEGVFLRYDEKTRKMLHLVEPWVVYGKPSMAVVNDLITRRGCGYVDRQRVPLSDNVTIEKALGNKNIICVEDLVHEVYTVGDSFHEATRFLWPFSLTDSKTQFERQVLKLKDGKDYGDKGEAINEYIKQVL